MPIEHVLRLVPMLLPELLPRGTISQLESLIAARATIPLLSGIRLDDARAHLAEVRNGLRTQLDRVEAELAGMRPIAELRQAVLDGTSAVESARRALALADEKRTTRQSRRAELVARLEQVARQHPSVLSADLGPQLDRAALDVSDAKALADSSATKLAQARTAEAAAKQALDASIAGIAAVDRQQEVIRAAVENLLRQWREAGLPAEVTEAAVGQELERLGQARRDLDRGLAEIKDLSTALDAWHQSADLQRLESDVRALHSPLDRDGYTDALDSDVQRCQRALVLRPGRDDQTCAADRGMIYSGV